MSNVESGRGRDEETALVARRSDAPADGGLGAVEVHERRHLPDVWYRVRLADRVSVPSAQRGLGVDPANEFPVYRAAMGDDDVTMTMLEGEHVK